MKRAHWLGLAAGITVAALLGAGWLAVHTLLPNGDALARRIEAEAQTRLGVKVTVGAARWQVLPQPMIEVRDVRTQQAQPIEIGRASLHPKLWLLLTQRVFVAERVELEHAVAGREAMAAFRGKAGPAQAAGADFSFGPVPLERFVFRDLTWISYSGVPVAYDGEIDFDPQWRPRQASVRRPGAPAPATLELKRDGQADRWQARIALGGGTAHGQVALAETAQGGYTLTGELAPQNIEVAAAMATFNRRAPISGRASGRTVLSARGDSVGELARSLRTESDLSVAQGVVLRLDLDKAIRTRGKERDGQTPLDSLTGHLQTQNTENGTRFTYTQLKAKAGKYTASGEAVIWQKQVDANGTLDIVDGLVGVPFTIKGPVQKPDVKVPPGFFAGAAIGTAVLPGVGTVIGARIGGAIGRIFGNDKKKE
jgi:uncharacterized protein involved in outer membrane biogenesis